MKLGLSVCSTGKAHGFRSEVPVQIILIYGKNTEAAGQAVTPQIMIRMMPGCIMAAVHGIIRHYLISQDIRWLP